MQELKRSINRIDKFLRPESNNRKNAGSRKSKVSAASKQPSFIERGPVESQRSPVPLSVELAMSASRQSILTNPSFLQSAMIRSEMAKQVPTVSPIIHTQPAEPSVQIQQFTLDQGLGVAAQMSDNGRQRISRAQKSNSNSRQNKASELKLGEDQELPKRDDLVA